MWPWFLVNLNTCPAGVLGWYCSPAKGPTPSSTLYLLFFPALSDTASQVACYSLFSFISMFSNPSDFSSFLIFICPVLRLLDPLYHPGSLISIPSSFSTVAATCLPHLPEEGLVFDTSYFQLIIHGNLHLTDSMWSVCLTGTWCRTWIKPDQMYIDIKCGLRDSSCSFLWKDHPPLQEIARFILRDRETLQLG